MHKKIISFIKNTYLMYFLYGIISLSIILIIVALGFFQFYLKPNIENIKNEIEDSIGIQTGGEVHIESLETYWNISNPSFLIKNFSITDRENEKTINLKTISFDISWLTLIKFKPILDEIIIGDLDIVVERTVDGKIKIAGIEIVESKDSKFSDWILNQKSFKLINGKVVWKDHQRNAPELVFSNINFNYESPTITAYINRHNYKFSSRISTGTEQKIYGEGALDLDKIENLKNAGIKAIFNLHQFYLPSLKPWLNYPFDVNQGFGDLKLLIEARNWEANEVKTIFNIENFIGNFNKNQNKDINLKEFSGNMLFKNEKNTIKLIGNKLNLITRNININNAAFEMNKNKEFNEVDEFKLKLNEINIKEVENFISQIPIFEDLTNNLKEKNPDGIIKNLILSWKKKEELILNANLLNFGINQSEKLPGVKNLNADIAIKNTSGSINVKSSNTSIIADHYLRNTIDFSEINGNINWDKNKIILNNFIFKNNDLDLKINSTYKNYLSKNPELSLKANSNLINIPSLKKYYFKQYGEETLHWLDTSLLAGQINNLAVNFNGPIHAFPFVNDKNEPDTSKGQFEVSADINNSFIEYGLGWPELDKFSFNLEVKNNGVYIKSQSGHVADNQIKDFYGEIKPFNTKKPMLKIKAAFDSPAHKMIHFVKNSPVKDAAKGFLDQMVADGDGALDLNLFIPMADIDAMKFKGSYTFNNATLENTAKGLPKFSKINAKANFDNDSFFIKDGYASTYDMPLKFSLLNSNEKTSLNMKGSIDKNFFIKNFGLSWADKVSGSSPWEGIATLDESSTSLELTSNLVGLEINGPEPFVKKSNESKNFQLTKKPGKHGNDLLAFTLGNDINAKLRFDKNNKVNGQINILTNEKFEKRKGLFVFANFNNINYTDFSSLLSPKTGEKNENPITQAKINFNQLNLNGYKLNRLETIINPTNNGSKISMYSNEVKGNALWNAKENIITARFNKVIIQPENTLGDTSSKIEKVNFTNFPKIDFKCDELIYKDQNQGSVEFITENHTDELILKDFKLTHPWHQIKADIHWKNKNQTTVSDMNFNWEVNKLRRTFDLFGYPNLVKDGTANVNGLISWDGSPFSFDKNIISGNFSVDARNGQILEAEPGVGRLFGLLTLQNLPKRLSLDFSDLFSKGFIFDSINAGVRIDSGVLKSNNFKMIGPAAEVKIDGQVDIVAETQNLHVSVKPFVSDSLSLAALAGGPLVGAAAFIAQKVLKDPLNKILTDEYQIIGTWDEPIEIDKPRLEEIKDNSKEQVEEIIKPSKSILDKLNIFKQDDSEKPQTVH